MDQVWPRYFWLAIKIQKELRAPMRHGAGPVWIWWPTACRRCRAAAGLRGRPRSGPGGYAAAERSIVNQFRWYSVGGRLLNRHFWRFLARAVDAIPGLAPGPLKALREALAAAGSQSRLEEYTHANATCPNPLEFAMCRAGSMACVRGLLVRTLKIGSVYGTSMAPRVVHRPRWAPRRCRGESAEVVCALLALFPDAAEEPLDPSGQLPLHAACASSQFWVLSGSPSPLYLSVSEFPRGLGALLT
jgi:hypothetical protein